MSLVDSVSALMIYIFSAMATGGAVVAGQYLGRREREEACRSAQQLMVLLGVVSLAVTALLYLFRDLIVTRLFGHIDADVMEATNIYYSYVMASIPGIALYNGGAALFRTMSRSGVSLKVSLLMNGINVAGNAILIFGLGFDVAGVANIGLPMIVVCIPTFLALMFVLTIKLRKSPFDLSYSHHAHQELVKGVTTEMSGRTLAKVEVMHWCETTLFLGWVAMFFIWDSPVSIVLAVVVAALAFFLEIFIDNNLARVKWQKCLKWAWIVALVCGLANTAWLVFALIA